MLGNLVSHIRRYLKDSASHWCLYFRKLSFYVVSGGREDSKQGFSWFPENSDTRVGLYNFLAAVEAPLRNRRAGESLVWFKEAKAVT